MSEFTHLLYEKPEEGIARIWLNRPDARNAQDTKLLYELNDAYDKAMQDDDVKVVILAAKGPHFSAGHDPLPLYILCPTKFHFTKGFTGGVRGPLLVYLIEILTLCMKQIHPWKTPLQFTTKSIMEEYCE